MKHVYDVMCNYGAGWNCVTSEESRTQAHEQMLEYKANNQERYRIKIAKRRVKK